MVLLFLSCIIKWTCTQTFFFLFVKLLFLHPFYFHNVHHPNLFSIVEKLDYNQTLVFPIDHLLHYVIHTSKGQILPLFLFVGDVFEILQGKYHHNNDMDNTLNTNTLKYYTRNQQKYDLLLLNCILNRN